MNKANLYAASLLVAAIALGIWAKTPAAKIVGSMFTCAGVLLLALIAIEGERRGR